MGAGSSSPKEAGPDAPLLDNRDSVISVGEGGENREKRSELAILLDSDQNGEISETELLVFFHNLVSTQIAHPDGRIQKNGLLYKKLNEALHSLGDGNTVTLSKVFGYLLQDTELWVQLTETYGVMDIALFEHFLLYAGNAGKSLKLTPDGQAAARATPVRAQALPPSRRRLRSSVASTATVADTGGDSGAPAAEGDELEKSFSLVDFIVTFLSFNALPLWLLSSWTWPASKGYLTRIRFAIYLHQCRKLRRQLGLLGLHGAVASEAALHGALLVLTWLQFAASWVPLVAYLAKLIAAEDRGQPFLLSERLSCWESVMPFAVLQFLIFSAALKLSCRDLDSIKDQCKVIFQLGNVTVEIPARDGRGRPTTTTVLALMDAIKLKARESFDSSFHVRCNAAMPLIFALGLEVLHRLARFFLVSNLVASEPLARWVLPFEVFGLIYNIWFAYSEPADCTEYLLWMKQVSSYFKVLLSREAAHAEGLPCLNKHTPQELLLWSKLRRYYQSPNPLALRAIEMHLTVVILAALAVTGIVTFAWLQGTLLLFTPENADLQLFVLWVIPCFIYLVVAFVFDVIWSSATGDEYLEGIATLSCEAVIIVDKIRALDGPAGAALSEPEKARDKQQLQECLTITEVLIRYMQLDAEYITLFGFALDTNLRNAIFTGAITLIGGAASTLLAMLSGGAAA